MKILYLSAELAPYAKVGGLADVAGSLPQALDALGHDVRVTMPLYVMVESDRSLSEGAQFTVRVNRSWIKEARACETESGGVRVSMIGTDEWFNETTSPTEIYRPGADPYLFFGAAALELCSVEGWKPDVVHCNDWHTGFVPVLMRERLSEGWKDVASVFTIHNLAYQGEFGREILDKLELSPQLFNPGQLEFFGTVNFLKSGCVYADQVSTVSPRYSKEIQTSEFGCRMEGLMSHLARSGRLEGILNGIDLDTFNPETDVHIAANYSSTDRSGKALCREALLKEVSMEPLRDGLLFGVVSRLSDQKGIDLVIAAADQMFAQGCQLVIQGIGDNRLARELKSLESRFPKHFRFIDRFDAGFAQRVYAGSDTFLMPSAFEPCGLGQMIAMRYGTVPVVRETGGLADTVRNGDNGFTFVERDADTLVDAVTRCQRAFENRDEWHRLQSGCLNADLGWQRSAMAYEALYERALKRRAMNVSLTCSRQ